MIPLHDLIKRRQSGRILDPDRVIEEEKVFSLLEAARWAPSCSNNQPWRIVVLRSTSLEKVKECLSRGNGWALNAPLILTLASKPDLDCQITGRDYYPLGVGLAIENILLQGIHMGLVMHPIAGFKEDKVKEVLGIPEDYRVHALVIDLQTTSSASGSRSKAGRQIPAYFKPPGSAGSLKAAASGGGSFTVGYPGSEEETDPVVLEKERLPRERKALSEIVQWKTL